MKFIVYPTRRDRASDQHGQLKEGDDLGPAAPSGRWVYVASERRYYRVFGAERGPVAGGQYLKSAIAEEAHQAAGEPAGAG